LEWLPINQDKDIVLYRLIATDVDGTLLGTDSRMPELNMEALLECRKKGIEVILATGKTMASITGLVSKLGLTLPQITLNGSVTVSPDMKVISASRIDPDTYREVTRFIRESGYPQVVALDDGNLYAEELHPDLKYLYGIGEEFIKVDSIDKQPFTGNTVDIYIPITSSDPLDRALRQKYPQRLQFVRSGEYFFDILNREATKGNALLKIIDGLGISPGEVAVFGDSPNDLSMFAMAGLRVAVKNSYPEVLEKADIITEENYNSGLGKAVYRYILKES
jgi:Cof subfamily protein (haloacid dehalogenase superfamily)